MQPIAFEYITIRQRCHKKIRVHIEREIERAFYVIDIEFCPSGGKFFFKNLQIKFLTTFSA